LALVGAFAFPTALTCLWRYLGRSYDRNRSRIRQMRSHSPFRKPSHRPNNYTPVGGREGTHMPSPFMLLGRLEGFPPLVRMPKRPIRTPS
jgi:hypothetical protein